MSTHLIVDSDLYVIYERNILNVFVDVRYNGKNYDSSHPLMVTDSMAYEDIRVNILVLENDITAAYSSYGVTAATIPAENITPLYVNYKGLVSTRVVFNWRRCKINAEIPDEDPGFMY